MRRKHIAPVMIVSASVFVVGVTLAENDRFALNAPNGIAFSEFKDYETWDVIGSSVTDDAGGCGSSPEPGCIKSIVGNTVMIRAFKAGIPANGQSVPDGAMMAKIEWYKARDPSLAYGAIVPGKFMEVAFMVKELEAIFANERMGIRHAQVRRRVRHI